MFSVGDCSLTLQRSGRKMDQTPAMRRSHYFARESAATAAGTE